MRISIISFTQESTVNQVSKHFFEITYDDIEQGMELLHMIITLGRVLEMAVIVLIMTQILKSNSILKFYELGAE